MSDDVKAVTERYRTPLAYEGMAKDEWYTYAQLMDDQKVIAQAYLAEHDPTPLTEEWLRSVGFNYDGELGEWINYGSGSSCLGCDDCLGNWRIGYVNIPTPTTRGQLRRLAACLGIELKKETP